MLYRVLQPMTLHPGALLGLSAAQVAARSFGLVPQGAQWRVTKPVGFKAGETLEHVGPVPKSIAHLVVAVPPPPLAAAAPKQRERKPATAEA